MAVFHKIRTQLGRFVLKKKTKQLKRYKTVHNFETASTAIILFECTAEEDPEIITRFRNHLEDQHISTSIIGYINEKEVPDQYVLRQGFHCFGNNDLNWIYIPVHAEAVRIMSQETDLLIDLTTRFCFPLHFLVTLSRARYKIGRLTEDTGYDLMIDIGQTGSVDYFTTQITHYLKLIKRSNETLIEETL